MKSILRKLLPLLLPLGIIIGASVIYGKTGYLDDSSQNLILYFSYVLLAVVILLSFIFNRSIVFFVATILLVSQALLMIFRAGNSSDTFNINAIRSIIYIILPTNITVLALGSDKGILSLKGRFRIGVIIVEYLFIGWVIVSSRTNLVAFISSTPINIGKLLPLPLLVFLIFCSSLIIFIARIVLFNSLKDRLLFGVLLSTFFGLFLRETSLSLPIFFSAAGVILLICALNETYFLAYIDELTGLPSRRALKERMMKLGGKYSITMIDIDFFKKFNDNFGHDSGDQVLRYIGRCFKQIPGGGKAYRYGGEEFTIIFPGKNLSEVLPHIEKLRESLSKSKIPISRGSKGSSKEKTRKVSITISAGLAEKSEKHPSPYDVLKAADAALYRAKDKGRNCVSK